VRQGRGEEAEQGGWMLGWGHKHTGKPSCCCCPCTEAVKLVDELHHVAADVRAGVQKLGSNQMYSHAPCTSPPVAALMSSLRLLPPLQGCTGENRGQDMVQRNKWRLLAEVAGRW
jgi:hypothetical protein